ncbi:hypothetical protein GCM10017653_00080 [Ancylobacter defluvii]|uniref:Uncharacterized protein n=1 Tax=Ancylobacter defluvii TaxID=1282440 RepID=A0A9W6N842_9HYPH|nr:hypothetical protein GCM10017653_00080 [Ancylobacter defluvii]
MEDRPARTAASRGSRLPFKRREAYLALRSYCVFTGISGDATLDRASPEAEGKPARADRLSAKRWKARDVALGRAVPGTLAARMTQPGIVAEWASVKRAPGRTARPSAERSLRGRRALGRDGAPFSKRGRRLLSNAGKPATSRWVELSPVRKRRRRYGCVLSRRRRGEGRSVATEWSYT